LEQHNFFAKQKIIKIPQIQNQKTAKFRKKYDFPRAGVKRASGIASVVEKHSLFSYYGLPLFRFII
jgi:hypothetical protein